MPSRVRYSKSIPLGLKLARRNPTPQSEAKHEEKGERGRFYAGRRWRALRAAFLASNPLCEDCLDEGNLIPATVAHHDEERLDNPDRAMDPANLRALCSPCHTRRHKKGNVDGR